MIKLVGSDIGGTLTDKNENISQYTVETINKLTIPFCFVTGYNRYISYKYLDNLPLNDYYLIAQNGSFCYHKKELLFSNLLDIETAEKAVDFALNSNCIARIFCTDNFVYCKKPKNYTDTPLRWDKPIYKFFDDNLTNLPSTIIQVAIFEPIEKIQKIEKQALKLFKNNCITGPFLYGTHKWLEFNNPQATKGKSFAKLANLLNIPLKDTIYFGDNYNDLDLLKKAGTSAVVADADEEIKAAADIVIAPGYEDGVAKYIQQHFLS